jgi:15-cis-phytoene synthase
MLRMLPIHRSRGQCYLPRDLLAASGMTAEEFVSADAGEGHRRAVAAMIALAREHLDAFRRGAVQLPQSLRPAYLPIALTERYLDRVEKADPLRETAGISPVVRHWTVFRRAMSGWR